MEHCRLFRKLRHMVESLQIRWSERHSAGEQLPDHLLSVKCSSMLRCLLELSHEGKRLLRKHVALDGGPPARRCEPGSDQYLLRSWPVDRGHWRVLFRCRGERALYLVHVPNQHQVPCLHGSLAIRDAILPTEPCSSPAIRLKHCLW